MCVFNHKLLSSENLLSIIQETYVLQKGLKLTHSPLITHPSLPREGKKPTKQLCATVTIAQMTILLSETPTFLASADNKQE